MSMKPSSGGMTWEYLVALENLVGYGFGFIGFSWLWHAADVDKARTAWTWTWRTKPALTPAGNICKTPTVSPEIPRSERELGQSLAIPRWWNLRCIEIFRPMQCSLSSCLRHMRRAEQTQCKEFIPKTHLRSKQVQPPNKDGAEDTDAAKLRKRVHSQRALATKEHAIDLLRETENWGKTPQQLGTLFVAWAKNCFSEVRYNKQQLTPCCTQHKLPEIFFSKGGISPWQKNHLHEGSGWVSKRLGISSCNFWRSL